MTQPLASVSAAADYYRAEFAALDASFLRNGDGAACLRRRSSLVDTVVTELWSLLGGAAHPIALVATGGYGRRELFPYSDIDLMFLCPDPRVESLARDLIRTMSQALWDTGLRASTLTRSVRECDRFSVENFEFTLSLLDRRLVGGDTAPYALVKEKVLPALIARESETLQRLLQKSLYDRYARFGGTIFHLEPNVKEAPGGLRDHHTAQWCTALTKIRETKAWPRSGDMTPDPEVQAAVEFMTATRCFLHLRSHRDDNILSWHAQDEAGAKSIGLETGGTADPAYWMRTYYRHARTFSRSVAPLLEQQPAALPFFARRRRKLTIEGTPFVLADGRIDLADEETNIDPESMLRVFAEIAERGSRPTVRAESAISDALPMLNLHLPEGPFLRVGLQRILLGRHAAQALRTMHMLGVLEMLVPEFHGIDALVIRDSYHRYTVDEHTFLTIENVHALRDTAQDWERRFAGLLDEIDRLDLLLLALLLHDTGKASRSGDHTTQSVELGQAVLDRLELEAEEREIVLALVRDHLAMSAALRRDIFDPETLRALAEKVATPTRLRMLCLMTYADVRAVNPEALTPWKAENLWQLFIATSNWMDRNVDEERYHASLDPALLRRITALVPDRKEQLQRFLEGLPQRYVQTRLPEQIRTHLEMSSYLEHHPAQLSLRKTRHLFELVLIAKDRPMLFADIAGTLSALGMNIVKAEAFANDAGIVVDSFLFADSFGTLELNPSEFGRFTQKVMDAVTKRTSVDGLMRARRHLHTAPVKMRVETRISFDDTASSASTVMQVVAQDGPGLLRAIASVIATLGCDIRVALIDTEGELAVDVFYLTESKRPLDDALKARLSEDLAAAIQTLRPAAAFAH
ncbi:MAG: HD domain-containing protein [Acidobacteriaceae bacterium]